MARSLKGNYEEKQYKKNWGSGPLTHGAIPTPQEGPYTQLVLKSSSNSTPSKQLLKSSCRSKHFFEHEYCPNFALKFCPQNFVFE